MVLHKPGYPLGGRYGRISLFYKQTTFLSQAKSMIIMWRSITDFIYAGIHFSQEIFLPRKAKKRTLVVDQINKFCIM